MARQAVAAGAATAVVTRGRNGSLAVYAGMRCEPPTRSTVVDTLGAGDAFIAGCHRRPLVGADLGGGLACGRTRRAHV